MYPIVLGDQDEQYKRYKGVVNLSTSNNAHQRQTKIVGNIIGLDRTAFGDKLHFFYQSNSSWNQLQVAEI